MFRASLLPTAMCVAAAGLVAGGAGTAAAQSTATASGDAARDRDSAVVAVERSIWEHIVHGRWDGATTVLGGALTVSGNGVFTWSAADTDRLRDMGCATTAYAMRDVQTREVAPDVVALGYRAVLSLKCGDATPTLSNLYLSVYRRRGTGWELVATSITRAAPPR
jgi:hypothetical protein